MAKIEKHEYVEFDYSTPTSRVQTALALFDIAKNEKAKVVTEWEENKRFYEGHHKLGAQTKDELGDLDDYEKFVYEYLVLTDPFIQVESQIDPNQPEPSFYGRDAKMDEAKAKQREYTTKFILQNNNYQSISTSIQRAVRLYGNAFVKTFWDAAMPDGKGGNGDIRKVFVSADDIFPDPSATNLNDCEWVDYVTYPHYRKVMRVYGDDLKRLGMSVWDIVSGDESETRAVTDTQQERKDMKVRVLEHWYRDDEGDIACSVIIGDKEIKHIPKYWENTRGQNSRYPFVHFYSLKSEAELWGKAEITVIKPLVIAGDRILQNAIRGNDLMANDAWIIEEGSLAKGHEITGEPGELIVYSKGYNAPRRAGGLGDMSRAWGAIKEIQQQIERTLRNYDTNQGKEPERTTTVGGLAQFRADAQTQSQIKNYDIQQAYKNDFILTDWTAVEFYTEDKMIFIGVPDGKKTEPMPLENLDAEKGDIYFTYNSKNMLASASGELDEEPRFYYPSVDCTVVASNAIERSKSFSVSVLQSLIATPITPENYKIVIKVIEELGIQGGQEIIDDIKNRYGKPIMLPQGLQAFIQQLPREQQDLLRADPMAALSIYAQELEQQMQTAFNTTQMV